MPKPFSQHHNGYIAAFKQTRQPRIIGTERLQIGLHKDGERDVPVPQEN